MKVTNFGDAIPLPLASWSTGETSIGSNADSNPPLSALNFVQRITANTSNTLLNPIVNFASGSGISLAAASNTITISSSGGGGGSGITVQDEGTPLSTTATTLNFVGAGVTASGTGATKTITIREMPWYNVEKYGAVHDGVTDDTVAIQAAIDACFAGGGGTVFFPPGIYQIDGALTSTSTYNSQLQIPTNTYTTTTPPMAIRFLGMTVVPLSDIGSAAGAHAVPPTGGSILRSSWDGSISGHPAIIAAGQWGQATNFMFVSFEDIMVMAHNDPKLTAVQLQSAIEWSVDRLSITVNADESAKSFCTHTNAVGLDAGIASEQPNLIQQLQIDSFYSGLVLGSEQAVATDINIGKCKQGISIVGNVGSPLFVRHANYFAKVLFYQCETGIIFTGDTRWVNIGLLNIEHDPAPFATIYDIDDASNYARGFIQWHTTDYTTGPDELIVNGATGISLFGANSKRWKLNNVVDIPIGTNPSTNPANGRRLYTDSSTGHLSARTSAGATIDYESSTSPLTTKGDVYGYSSTNARIPIGTDGQVLTADSAQTLGLKWATPTSTSGAVDHEHVQNIVFSGDGATTVWELPVAPVDATSIAVYVTASRSIAWVLSGTLLTTLTFDSAPASAANNIVIDVEAAVS